MTYIQTIMDKLINDLKNEKTNLIKSELKKVGLSDIANNIEKARFKKIERCIYKNWEYYFVDDNTINGKFLIAFEQTDFINTKESDNFSLKYTAEFRYHTDINLVPQIILNNQILNL
jgi:hypothetical protein